MRRRKGIGSEGGGLLVHRFIVVPVVAHGGEAYIAGQLSAALFNKETGKRSLVGFIFVKLCRL